MSFIELFLLAIGVSMDAFAVAVSIGLTLAKTNIKKALIVGLYFGLFQGIMPLIGYLAASRFAERIAAYSHWVAFGLLVILGGKMIIGSFKKEKCTDRTCPAQPCTDRLCPTHAKEASLTPKAMLPLALATSIDALAVGVSLAFLYVSIMPAVSFIGVFTFALSVVGVRIGNIVGAKFKSRATFAGGVILVLMGVWVLVEHLA